MGQVAQSIMRRCWFVRGGPICVKRWGEELACSISNLEIARFTYSLSKA